MLISCFKPLKHDVEQYLDADQVATIQRAFELAKVAHRGQKRRSGEAYITHPVSVARILAGMRMDMTTICAAILHDVIEDTAISKDALIEQFGESVADLVDGVTKLTQIKFETRAEAQAENFRKMVLAMSRDIRVILIKLADRLHNMRTLDAMPANKKRRIAMETLEIYAPIANRLGMHDFRIEFEDLGFKAMHPMRHNVLKKSIHQARSDRKKIIGTIEKALRASLDRAGIQYSKVWGREKHLYSIYKKMRNKRIPLSQIMDIFAFRIIVNNEDACYRCLGAIHKLYKPVNERFKDYIAIPKTNGYQSLHTTLFGPFGVPIEVQIRTQDMNQVAANGIAAHWIYKSDNKDHSEAQIRTREWMKSLMELQQNTGSSLEFIENVKIDLFPDEVYVFSPKGHVFKLPRGATAVDFAFAVHSDIGNACVAVKINRQLSPLSTVLASGQRVEVITAPGALPNPAWLNFVVTGKARSNIRHSLKQQQQRESVQLGKMLLESALEMSIARVAPDSLDQVIKQYQYSDVNELYENIGLGNRIALVVAQQLLEHDAGLIDPEENTGRAPVMIKGGEGVIVQFAKCCCPIPGDHVVGLLSSGRGLVIHTESCRKVANMSLQANKYIPVRWEDDISGEFSVDVIVDVINARGSLGQVATALANAGANIENISIEQNETHYHRFVISIHVRDRIHLARVMRRVRNIKPVSKIVRRK